MLLRVLLLLGDDWLLYYILACKFVP